MLQKNNDLGDWVRVFRISNAQEALAKLSMAIIAEQTTTNSHGDTKEAFEEWQLAARKVDEFYKEVFTEEPT